MKKFFALAGFAVAALLGSFIPSPQSAAAHPLGNFTVNRLARIELAANGNAHLRYVVDMAEIAAFQERQTIDRNGDGTTSDAESAAYLDARIPELVKRVDLRVGGEKLTLHPTARELTFPPGQAGLYTMRLVADFDAPLPKEWQDGAEATFKDGNYSDRIGWREIVIIGQDGVSLTASSAALTDTTAELTVYPTDELKSAPDRREASFKFKAGPAVLVPQTLNSGSVSQANKPGKTLDGFAGLVSREDLTPAFIAISMLAAMAWGAAHALGPGHGKTIVAAYLVGSRGTARHALLLGASVTVAHTAGVVSLGLATLAASRLIKAEDLFVYISVISALLVVAMGLVLLVSRLRAAFTTNPAHSHDHDDGHPHDHTHSDHSHEHMPTRLQVNFTPAKSHDHSHHGHSHAVPEGKGWKGIVALGLSAGLLPCPTALVVMLGAIAIDRTVYGLALVGAFSVGLAGVLTGIGLVLVYASQMLGNASKRYGFMRSGLVTGAIKAAPVLSALVILIAGLVMSGRTLGTL